MNSTNALTSADASGSRNMKPKLPALMPWEIAELPLFRFKDAQIVDVESATDAQFEAWRKKNGIPVKDNGIVEWSFEMRCRAINQCRFYGFWDALKFPIDFSASDAQPAQNAPEEGD